MTIGTYNIALGNFNFDSIQGYPIIDHPCHSVMFLGWVTMVKFQHKPIVSWAVHTLGSHQHGSNVLTITSNLPLSSIPTFLFLFRLVMLLWLAQVSIVFIPAA